MQLITRADAAMACVLCTELWTVHKTAKKNTNEQNFEHGTVLT